MEPKELTTPSDILSRKMRRSKETQEKRVWNKCTTDAFRNPYALYYDMTSVHPRPFPFSLHEKLSLGGTSARRERGIPTLCKREQQYPQKISIFLCASILSFTWC